MKVTVLALVTTAALFLSTGTASAQLRYSTFNGPFVAGPGLNPAPFTPSFAPSTSMFPNTGFSAGFGNFNSAFGNNYTTWSPGFAYGYPVWNYTFVGGQPYWGYNSYARPYGGFYGSTPSGPYYGLHRHHWNR
jgi:hypothetical protein